MELPLCWPGHWTLKCLDVKSSIGSLCYQGKEIHINILTVADKKWIHTYLNRVSNALGYLPFPFFEDLLFLFLFIGIHRLLTFFWWHLHSSVMLPVVPFVADFCPQIRWLGVASFGPLLVFCRVASVPYFPSEGVHGFFLSSFFFLVSYFLTSFSIITLVTFEMTSPSAWMASVIFVLFLSDVEALFCPKYPDRYVVCFQMRSIPWPRHDKYLVKDAC